MKAIKLACLLLIPFMAQFAQPQPAKRASSQQGDSNQVQRFVSYTSKQFQTKGGLFQLKRVLTIREECLDGKIRTCKNQFMFIDQEGDGSYDHVKARLGDNYSTSRIVSKKLEEKINKEILDALEVQKARLELILQRYMSGKLKLTVIAKTVPFQSTEYHIINADGPDFILAIQRPDAKQVGLTVKFIALGTIQGTTLFNMEIWGLNQRLLAILPEENKISHKVAENMKDIGKKVYMELQFDHGTNHGFIPSITNVGTSK